MSYQDYIDRQNQELMEDLFGKGPYDPDVHGYAYEHDDNCRLLKEGGPGSNCDCSFSKGGSDENISDK